MQTIQLMGGKWLAYDLGFTPGGSYAGFVGARMVPAVGVGEGPIEQVIEIEMGDEQAKIEAGLQILGRALEDAAEQYALGGPLVYLECQVGAGDPFWRTPVYSGWIEIIGAGVDQRANGSMGVRLHLTRANWWETKDETELYYQVPVTNHRDAGHSNQIFTGENALTDEDLYSQARLVVQLTTVVTVPVALFVGERIGSTPALDLFIEGEEGTARSGVTGSTVADAGSSNGSYYNLAWSGSAEVRLWHVDVSAVKVGQCQGKAFRPVVRLGDSLPSTASEKTWAKWEVAYLDGGGVEHFLSESPGAYLDAGKELLLGPVVYLPPWIPQHGVTGLRVVLKVSAAGSGAHALKLDYVDLCALDGWREYQPVLGSTGLDFVDDGRGGMVGSWAADGVMTHSAEGPGLWIGPGKGNELNFYFSTKEAAELAASANLAGLVSLYYRPRKRVL